VDASQKLARVGLCEIAADRLARHAEPLGDLVDP
jgi:hypothetical protein